MYRNTRFGELLKGFPRRSFQKLVEVTGSDKHYKRFRSWDHLVSMVYAQFSGCSSLREIEAGFNSQSIHHYHLGVGDIRRSTLSEANGKRDARVFERACGLLLQQASRQVRKELKDLIYLLDSTPIPLEGLGYDAWAAPHRTSRSQGLKVHMQYQPDAGLPTDMAMTPPNVPDVLLGRETRLEAGATYVFDKGYYDYNWWHQIDRADAVFVTRLKTNAGIKVTGALDIPPEDQAVILKDERIQFKNKRPGGHRVNDYHGREIRRVMVYRPDKDSPLVLVTNDFDRSAAEIALLYKQRWGIELFFKWLKQNLKIKQFIGRSENAVRVQIYTAMIGYLLLHRFRQTHQIGTSMKLLLTTLKTGLFQRMETEHTLEKRRRSRIRENQAVQGCLAL